jgi:PHP family Zn ribbon phosphoesterase
MRRRKKYGYILLTMLVVSGLAGTPYNNALTKKERKFSSEHMKSNKADVFSAVDGLSKAQLDFRTAAHKLSIRECFYQIAVSEKNLWNILESSLKSIANPEKRSEIKITDHHLEKMLEQGSYNVRIAESFDPKKPPYKSIDEALSFFKKSRADHIKYLKNTSEDLKNHVVQMPFGWLDCYQLSLVISAHSNQLIREINEIKSDPGFPK